jgi:1-acyl-sn-glycerol-3-phosphate acyltransferase
MRLALRSNAPVIPCIIIGAEESHLNLGSIQLNRISEDLRIPFPVNLFPLPAKWKIEFLDPIDISSTLLNQKQNHHQLRLLSDQIQRRLQLTINRRLLRRRTSFLKRRRASGSASF